MKNTDHLANTPADLTFKDHTEIIDALYRFGAGQDTGDKALFESAFAPNATLDFTGPAARFGVEMPVLKGRDNIVNTIMHAVSGLATTHTVTNPRVALEGSGATLFALVEAQHVPKNDHTSNLLLKNIYTVSLVREQDSEQGKWLVQDMKIENVWFQGNPAVLFPA
ncbi:nuclear transport factor 2 family protein [Paraherbaspirillum soli]|uniref:Nuclear transport factor 2 family protein n=1 Tax=Paraherbaspirillum soli TaxID=631222 RepID=A0ABW0MAX4_9BURK